MLHLNGDPALLHPRSAQSRRIVSDLENFDLIGVAARNSYALSAWITAMGRPSLGERTLLRLAAVDDVTAATMRIHAKLARMTMTEWVSQSLEIYHFGSPQEVEAFVAQVQPAPVPRRPVRLTGVRVPDKIAAAMTAQASALDIQHLSKYVAQVLALMHGSPDKAPALVDIEARENCGLATNAPARARGSFARPRQGVLALLAS